MQAALYGPDNPFPQSRPLDDRSFAPDHWQVKMLTFAEGILTEGGRVLAVQRQDKMIAFLSSFAQDISHDLPDFYLKAYD